MPQTLESRASPSEACCHLLNTTLTGSVFETFHRNDKEIVKSFTSRTEPAGQSEINDLDGGTGGVNTHNVFRFEVQMDDVLLMHVGDPLQDLLHVAHTGRFCVLEVVVNDALKQFPARDTTDGQTMVTEYFFVYALFNQFCLVKMILTTP